MNFEEPVDLAAQIQKKISYRIVGCLFISFAVVFGITAFDVLKNFDEVQKIVELKCKSLADFSASQLLVDNKLAVNLKLEDFNRNNLYKIDWIQKGNMPISGALKRKAILSWEYNCPIESGINEHFGYLHVTGSLLQDNNLLDEFCARILLIVLFAVTIFFLLYPLTKKIPRQLFIEPITNLLNLLKTGSSQKSMSAFSRELIEIDEKIKQLIEDAYQKSKMSAFAEFAAQIAHDIRSPLAALDLVVRDISSIPEEQRILIRNSTNRIYDIANNLLDNYKHNTTDVNEAASKNAPELISDLVLSAVSEKRAQYKGKSVVFIITIDEVSRSVFINVSASTFKRVISNLLNNSVEALECNSNGIINIEISIQLSDVTLTVSDNGSGISPDLLQKIVSGMGESQKKNGNGLGLPHAIKKVEEDWNGRFTIQSRPSEGTKISIILKSIPAPGWFLSEVIVLSKTNIIILDDDESIHQVWRKRFSETKNEIIFSDFYNSKNFIAEYQHKIPELAIFLVDLELIGSNMTGLDAIDKLNIAHNAYLVTSRYEDLAIRERCIKLGIRIIPKKFAPYIPIRVKDIEYFPDLIIIDDNEILTDAWILYGKKMGKCVAAFNKITDLKFAIPYYSRNIPIYVDFDLNDALSGKELSKELYEMGFANLYLVTGYPASHFGEMPWIKGILGKDAPF